MTREEAIRTLRRQADALARRGYDDAPYVSQAIDVLVGTPAPELTKFERDALTTLVAAIVNDGLDSYGITGREEAAIRRALSKLNR